MDDTISRQATIRFIREKVSLSTFMKRSIDKADKACVELCEMIARELPSAERQGRWIEEYSANHLQAKCSACGKSTLYGISYDLKGNAYYMNYCPSCGARMDLDEVE